MSDGVVDSFNRLMDWVEIHFVTKVELRKLVEEMEEYETYCSNNMLGLSFDDPIIYYKGGEQSATQRWAGKIKRLLGGQDD